VSWDKTGDPRILKRWYGHMEVEEYVYPAGLAGEIFLKNLKEKGVLTGSCCEKCGVTYMPARAFCECCFSKIEKYVECEPKGYVKSYTIVYIDKDGNKLEKPEIIALIHIPGAKGGIIHRLGEVEPEDVCINMEVEAVLKPKEQREGSITDILYFKPTTK